MINLTERIHESLGRAWAICRVYDPDDCGVVVDKFITVQDKELEIASSEQIEEAIE